MPFAAAMVAFGAIALIAFAFVHVDGTAAWWATLAWVCGLIAFLGGAWTVGTRWIGDPWWLSQRLGALAAGLAGAAALLAFAWLVADSIRSGGGE